MIQSRRLFVPRVPLADLHRRLRPLLGHLRPLSASNSSGKDAAPPPATVDGDGGIVTREEAYRQIHDLDFMKAAKILFTTPPKRKQFGFDFHLVQFFFVCMPSLAVYLVAQYAQYEIRRMEANKEGNQFHSQLLLASLVGPLMKRFPCINLYQLMRFYLLFCQTRGQEEAELKKNQAEEEEEKAKEERKAKEAELRSVEEGSSDSELTKVIVRLDALEEVVKEIADEKKCAPSVDSKKDRDAAFPILRPN